MSVGLDVTLHFQTYLQHVPTGVIHLEMYYHGRGQLHLPANFFVEGLDIGDVTQMVQEMECLIFGDWLPRPLVHDENGWEWLVVTR